jgi:dipeptidase E
MSTVQVLAFSSSRVGNGTYLENAVPVIKQFLGGTKKNIAFVPFASVDSYDDYAEKVSNGLSALPHEINLALADKAKTTIENADVIMIGGGNTFKLLHDLYALDLIELIKQKVQKGTPYIGWSAGSNLTGPTICTTNDMPILEPESFASFGFFSFQLNPHYYNVVIEGFHGETRDQRLEEYLKANSNKRIMALPEGTWLQLQNDKIRFDGIAQGVMMSREEGQTIHRIIQPGTML